MTSKYHAVQSDEKFQEVEVFPNRSSTSDSLGSTLLEEEGYACKTEPRRREKWFWLGHAVLLSVSFALFASSYYTRLSTLRHVQEFSAYSPAAKAIQYQTVKFNNTMGEGSPYVGKGPDVDKAWDAISYDIGDQMISEAEMDIIGMPKSHVKVKHPKTGVEGWRVGLEVFHQLHCVNLLRQVTYKDYYYDKSGDIAEGAEILQMHTDHCLEILRLNIQCNADIGVFTLYTLPGDPVPWPELDSWHKCRNFDLVKEWALENSVGVMERPAVEPQA
ncbi:hypothetical protein B7494_g277 [Chlorociboria aeruginascens]|nr:hypothetical protein B7494_g277 [Chlorociboria aeruginascens]